MTHRRSRRARWIPVAVAVAVAVAACSSAATRAGDDAAGSTAETTDDPTTTVSSTSAATTTSAPVSASEELEGVLAADRDTLSEAAASGDFCSAYGAYDLLAARADTAGDAEAVAVFRVGFEGTAQITPLVPSEIAEQWAKFVFGAGLVDQAIAATGTLPDGDAELQASLDRLGYYEAGDEVTGWYLDHCG